MTTDSDVSTVVEDNGPAPSLLDFAAAIHLGIGSISQQLADSAAKDARDRQAKLMSEPNYLPLVRAGTADANGVAVIDLGIPAQGRNWTIRQLAAAVAGKETSAPGGSATGGTTTSSAGGAASLTIPKGSVVQEIDAIAAPATTTGTATLTLTVDQGTFTWLFTEFTAGGGSNAEFTRTFTKPLTTFNAAGSWAIGALASGGQVTLDWFGTSVSTSATVGWYVGSLTALGSSAGITAQHRHTQSSLPAEDTFTSNIIVVPSGERLFAIVTGASTGDIIVARALILDEPTKAPVGVMLA